MTQPTYRTAGQRLHLIAWLGVYTLAWSTATSTVHAQYEASPTASGEVPWRSDVGAGRLTTPGQSRVLPRADEGPGVRTARRIDRFEDGSRDRLASAQRDTRGQAQGQPETDGEAQQWWKEEVKPYSVQPGGRRSTQGRSPRGQMIKESQIVAWVGSEPILAGDLLGRINEMLAPAIGRAPEAEIEKQRWLLMERMLPSAIESKMVYLAFIREMEKEQVAAIRESVYEQFDEQQIDRLVKQAEVRSAAELEKRLRGFGSSIDSVRRSFFEQVAAREMIRQATKGDEEVTHFQLLAYYQDHLDDYAIPAKARWEQLSAKFSDYDSRADADAAIARMGNAVLRGAPLQVVAKKSSSGFTAAEGGQHDWTTKGSLVSQVLDKAIFTIPLGRLSDVLEDDDGFHIIRVIERNEATRVPFRDAQVEIRDRIKEEARDQKVKEFLDGLKQETYVWNYFEEQSQLANRKENAPPRF